MYKIGYNINRDGIVFLRRPCYIITTQFKDMINR